MCFNPIRPVEKDRNEVMIRDIDLTIRPKEPEAAAGELTECMTVPERTRVVVLPIDPFKVFAYWEIAEGDVTKAEKHLGKDFSRFQPVLRLCEAGRLSGDRVENPNHADIEVELQPGNCYISLRHPENMYYAELGLKSEEADFLPLAGSTVVQTPRAQPLPRKEDPDRPAHVPLPAPPRVETQTDHQAVPSYRAEKKIDAMDVIARSRRGQAPDSDIPEPFSPRESFSPPELLSPLEPVKAADSGFAPETGASTPEFIEKGSQVGPGTTHNILPPRDNIVHLRPIAPKYAKRPDLDLVELCEQVFTTGISSIW